jgi:hypothetical protein
MQQLCTPKKVALHARTNIAHKMCVAVQHARFSYYTIYVPYRCARPKRTGAHTRHALSPALVSQPCCDTGPGSYSGPPDGLPAHLRHTLFPPRASTVQPQTITRITPRIGAPDHPYGLPDSTDTFRIRTTPYGTTPTYYGLGPDSYAAQNSSDVLRIYSGPL